MGINYKDSVIVYNRLTEGALDTEYYVGTRYDNVRVELTQGANINSSGLETANSVRVKIPRDAVYGYVSPAVWNALPIEEKAVNETFMPDSIILLAKKDNLGIDIDAPEGLIKSDDYDRGFLSYIKRVYGYTFAVKTVDVYDLIPRFELGGR